MAGLWPRITLAMCVSRWPCVPFHIICAPTMAVLTMAVYDLLTMVVLTMANRACRKKKTPTTLRTTKSIIRCGSGTRRSSEITRAHRVQSGATWSGLGLGLGLRFGFGLAGATWLGLGLGLGLRLGFGSG